MKTTLYALLFFLLVSLSASFAQETISPEKYGKTLNVGVGLGYYGYIGHPIPVMHADFEFDLVRNFTLAPFITCYSYQNYNYWGNQDYVYKNYYYRETVIPMGVKGTYYFDQLFKAGPKWDFYAAVSVGFAIRQTTWESGYHGETVVRHNSSPLYLDAHIGAEYHLNTKAGLFLDLSTGISTFGLAMHF
jgi:hypothetical protein